MIYLQTESGISGPFSADELSALWKAGEIGDKTRYWYRGMPRWSAVDDFKPPVVEPRTPPDAICLTTAPTFATRPIEAELDIVTAEYAFGMNLLQDLLVSLRNTVGGRSGVAQGALRDARAACLTELRRQAYVLTADGVVAVDLDYSQMGASANPLVLVIASGTAVRLAPPPIDDP